MKNQVGTGILASWVHRVRQWLGNSSPPRRRAAVKHNPLEVTRLEARELMATMNMGDMIGLNIHHPSHVHVHQFRAPAHSRIELVARNIAWDPGFNVRVDLFAPNGSLVRTFTGNSPSQTIDLPNQTGLYSLRVADDDRRQAGYYYIGLESVKPPSRDAVPMGVGEVRRLNTFHPVQKDQYVFFGRKGDLMDLTVQGIAHEVGFRATASLYSPAGNLVTRFNSTAGNHRVRLPETGNYILQLADDDLRQTGWYQVGVERLSGPSADAVQLPRNSWVTRHLHAEIQKDQYWFSGSVNQLVTLQANRYYNAPSFDALIEVFDRSGNRLTAFRASQGQVSFRLPSTGTYVIQVSEFGLDSIGSYQLRWI